MRKKKKTIKVAKKKLVKRERDESDNRIIKVFLTKRGEKIYTSIEVQLEKIGYLIEQQFDENSKGVQVLMKYILLMLKYLTPRD